MSTITKSMLRTRDFLRGRIGATLLLILSCVVCVSVFSDYIESGTVTADGKTQTYVTLRNNPKEIITQTGLAFDEEDQYKVIEGDDNTTDIEILRAFTVCITDAGKQSQIEITEGTVADALMKAGVAVPDNDDALSDGSDGKAIDINTALYPYMNIVLDRVKYDTATTKEVLKYKTVKHETKALPKGQTRKAVVGVDGEKEVVTQYKWVNDELVSVDIVRETVITAAVDEVVDVGIGVAETTAPSTAPTTAPTVSNKLSTKQQSHSANTTGGQFVDSNGRTVSYTKVLTGPATAYTAEAGAMTATGRAVEVGIVAVDPAVIPYGTRLYIVSADGKQVYGYALAADTGSALQDGGALVDLYYSTESQCLAFGRRDVIVYILG